MLFRKNIEPRCAYCAHAKDAEPDTVICEKKGPMPVEGSCRKFRYNPLRRTPPKPKSPDFSRYDDCDFSL